VRRVKRDRRGEYNSEEKVRLVVEGLWSETATSAVYPGEDINPRATTPWLSHFMEAGKVRLQADTARNATQVEVET